MIAQIEALHYRSLRYVRQSVNPFQVLIGPNASGKSTFLDVVGFLADLLRSQDGAVGAVTVRAPDLRDLTWLRQGEAFELAVEAAVPETLSGQRNGQSKRLRYEVRVGQQPGSAEVGLLAETFWLRPESEEESSYRPLEFPMSMAAPPAIVKSPGQRTPVGWQRIVNKVPESGNDYFRSETSGWNNLFRLGPRRSALANLPEDEEKFPAAVWFRRLLLDGVQRIALNSEMLRRPSRPGMTRRFLPDGSNLASVVSELEEKHSNRVQDWVAHVQTALPDLAGIRTVEREEDRHRYLLVKYNNGLGIPSWLVSDGTLRMLALTILAYLPDLTGIYLVEEPQNGIHPRAVETVWQSLCSVYGAQILLATHSPVILSLTEPQDVLCFGRDELGATAIVRGSEHPKLSSWRHQTDLGTLFAAGVLG